MALNKDMIQLLQQLNSNNSLSDEQKAVIIRQLQSDQDQGKQSPAVQEQVINQEQLQAKDDVLDRLNSFFGYGKVERLDNGGYALDLDEELLDFLGSNSRQGQQLGAMNQVNAQLKQMQAENKQLKERMHAMEQKAISERLNKIAYDTIQSEGYDPAKICKIMKPTDYLKVENGQVKGLEAFMGLISEAGFSKTTPKDEYSMLQQIDWTTDYQQPKEKSGLDSLFDSALKDREIAEHLGNPGSKD